MYSFNVCLYFTSSVISVQSVIPVSLFPFLTKATRQPVTWIRSGRGPKEWSPIVKLNYIRCGGPLTGIVRLGYCYKCRLRVTCSCSTALNTCSKYQTVMRQTKRPVRLVPGYGIVVSLHHLPVPVPLFLLVT